MAFLVTSTYLVPLIIFPTPTPEPIVPTRTAEPTGGPAGAAAAPTITIPSATRIPAPPTLSSQSEMITRIGLAGALDDVDRAVNLGLRFGNYTFWRVSPELPDVPGLSIWQTVRLDQIGEPDEWPAVSGVIEQAILNDPGSFWMIGNEPDVPWQDNVTAEEYAAAYHDIYHFIKERDPSARIGAGGIALPTPLRLAYLDRVLQYYQEQYGEPMPVDLWAIHLFILREEAGGWGIGIPPGMTETVGQLFEIEDHGDIELMKAYVVSFREWMAANNYGDLPLAVTEFGILLPEDYGFPPEFVQGYMTGAFDYFATASGEIGQAADGGRLVQYAFWYSLYDEGAYQTGNLLNGELGVLTELGVAFIRYIDGLIGEP